MRRDLRVLRPMITATVALALLTACGGGDDNKATDKSSDGGASSPSTPSGPDLATFDQPKAFAPVSGVAEGDVAGQPNLYYIEAGMVGQTALYALRTGLSAYTLSANSWQVPSSTDPTTTKTAALTKPMAVQLNGKEAVAIAYSQEVEGTGTQKSHEQVTFQWIDPDKGEVLATAVADLTPVLGTGSTSSGIGWPVYDAATGQIAVSLQAKYSDAAPNKDLNFSVFADPTTKKTTTIPSIRAAGIVNGVVVGAKGGSPEGSKNYAIVQVDGASGAVKKTVPLPAMESLVPAGSGGKHAWFVGNGTATGAKDGLDSTNAIYAADIATGAVVTTKLPNSTGGGADATCFSDHVAAVVCNRSLGDKKSGIAGFDDSTGKLLWSYDSSGNRVVPTITALYNGLVYGQADTQPAMLDAKTGQDVLVPSATPSATPTDGTTPDDTSSDQFGNVGGWGDTSLLYGNPQSPVMVSKYGSVYLQEPGQKASPKTEKILVVQKAIG